MNRHLRDLALAVSLIGIPQINAQETILLARGGPTIESLLSDNKILDAHYLETIVFFDALLRQAKATQSKKQLSEKQWQKLAEGVDETYALDLYRKSKTGGCELAAQALAKQFPQILEKGVRKSGAIPSKLETTPASKTPGPANQREK